jgi:outer membrane immunogenic protein
MQFRHLPALASGFLLSVSAATLPAFGADIAVPANDPWTGFYLGAQAGNLKGTGSDADFCITGALSPVSGCLGGSNNDGVPSGLDVLDNLLDGASAGGYLGFNYRLDRVVLGLEADLNWDHAEGKSHIPGDVTTDTSFGWDASFRARLGALVGERGLIYVTGGPSWLSMDIGSDLCGYFRSEYAGSAVDCGGSGTEFGWQLGAGAEFLLTDNISLKAEYLHGWYGNQDLNLVTVTEGAENLKYSYKQTLQTNVVRAGVAYHFGGF